MSKRIQSGRPTSKIVSNEAILKQYQDLVDEGGDNYHNEGTHNGEAFSFKYEVIYGYIYLFDFTYSEPDFGLSDVEIQLLQSSLNTFNEIY